MTVSAVDVFRRFAIEKLRQNCGRIEECLVKLSDEQIWQRFGENSNSAGNLVLHLCGNVRQWIGFGIAGHEDIRVRDQEFAAGGGLSGQQLRARLAVGVEEAAGQIERLPAEQFLWPTSVQVYTLSKLEAIFHVVEHFSMHTGQIILITKALTGEDLGFYKFLAHPSGRSGIPDDAPEETTP